MSQVSRHPRIGSDGAVIRRQTFSYETFLKGARVRVRDMHASFLFLMRGTLAIVRCVGGSQVGPLVVK